VRHRKDLDAFAEDPMLYREKCRRRPLECLDELRGPGEGVADLRPRILSIMWARAAAA
jgi:hypothetical protein